MIVCDTSGLYEAYDEEQPGHGAAKAAIEAESGPFMLSPFVLAELDYLLLTRLGDKAESRLLDEVSQGIYELCPMTADDVATAHRLIRKYTDFKIGLADASIAVIAARYETTRILTFDERHFRAIDPLWGKSFTLLPVDGRSEP